MMPHRLSAAPRRLWEKCSGVRGLDEIDAGGVATGTAKGARRHSGEGVELGREMGLIVVAGRERDAGDRIIGASEFFHGVAKPREASINLGRDARMLTKCLEKART